ncbi:MAG: HIT family protein [Gammaproteobacteria bacterium]|nr:HIT family protein [Gammaproteobacteria bacterium]
MTDCLFCKIATNEIPSIRVYEDDTVYAMMDIFPESKGHLLIIPKQHGENLFEIDDSVLAHVISVSKRIAGATKKALNADGIRIAQFNGAAAGQTVFHYHMHVIPAYSGVDLKRHAGTPADTDVLQQYADAIQAQL